MAGWILRVCGTNSKGLKVSCLITLPTRDQCRRWARAIRDGIGVATIARGKSITHLAADRIMRIHYFRSPKKSSRKAAASTG